LCRAFLKFIFYFFLHAYATKENSSIFADLWKISVATDYFQQFSIQFSGLSDGQHRFEFEIEDRFFASIPNAVVPAGAVHVDVVLTKQPNMITLDFDFKGNVETICDRCAVSSMYPVEGNQRLILKLGDEPSGDEDLIVLHRGEHEFNIAQHIYEYIALSLPLRIVPCETLSDKQLCDKTTLARLDELSVAEEPIEADPRWAKLNELKNP
jgi:uncharacterized metal-binding protein YceD (DUF177 family)